MNSSLYTPICEITPFTMAILPQRDENGNVGSYVLEEKEDFFVKASPSKMIDLACKFFGASLKGRQIGTKEISNMTHKLPISIDPSSGMYFFPTLSPINPKCAWLAHTHIQEIKEVGNQRTEIFFKNGLSIIVNVSYGSIMNQINRTAQYRYVLDERIKSLQSDERIKRLQSNQGKRDSEEVRLRK
jgi:competence protein ComK